MSVTQFKEFCSNPDCNYTAAYKLVSNPSKFCTKCGSKIITKCAGCGKEFPENAENFCPECGTKIKESK